MNSFILKFIQMFLVCILHAPCIDCPCAQPNSDEIILYNLQSILSRSATDWVCIWKHILEWRLEKISIGNIKIDWKHSNEIGNRNNTLWIVKFDWKQKVQFRSNHFGNIFSIYWIIMYTTMKMFPISNNCFEPMHCVSNRISQFPNFVSYLNLG